MPSHDPSFLSAASDIRQHTVHNEHDWEPEWVFGDERFNLLWCADAELIRLLCEMLHPVVRPDAAEVERLAMLFNERLGKDGWELNPATLISGRPVFAGWRLAVQLHHALAAVRTTTSPHFRPTRAVTNVHITVNPCELEGALA